MARYSGITPQSATKQAVEKFEDEVILRHSNQMLISRVYVDMQEMEWALAIAYNCTRDPGITGRENYLEVRYSCQPAREKEVKMFRSDREQETILEGGEFGDPDSFVRYALSHERSEVVMAG